MKNIFASLVGIALFFGSMDALAERFQFEKTAGGLARLDTQTGQVSLCRMQQDQLVCKMAADDREAYELEIARLQNQQPNLKDSMAELESMFDEDQVDEMISSLKGVARGMLEVMKQMQENFHQFERELNQRDHDPENGMKL